MALLPQPAREDIQFAAVMHALADPVRLRLLAVLADDQEHPCSDAAAGIGVHPTTMSHHYRVLREAGVLSTRREGRTRYIRLRCDDLDALFPGVIAAAVIAGGDLTADA